MEPTAIRAMLSLLDDVYSKVNQYDIFTSQWNYYEGLRAMASLAIRKSSKESENYQISIDSKLRHHIYDRFGQLVA